MAENSDEKSTRRVVILKQVVVRPSFIDFLERKIQNQKLEQERIKAMQVNLGAEV